MVVLYDSKGNIVGGTDGNGDLVASQIVLAPKLEGDALLGDTSEGMWIYWIEPEDAAKMESLPSEVRAELYRVDNALTNEGQRLVSDTKFKTVPDKGALPSISFNQN